MAWSNHLSTRGCPSRLKGRMSSSEGGHRKDVPERLWFDVRATPTVNSISTISSYTCEPKWTSDIRRFCQFCLSKEHRLAWSVVEYITSGLNSSYPDLTTIKCKISNIAWQNIIYKTFAENSQNWNINSVMQSDSDFCKKKRSI